MKPIINDISTSDQTPPDFRFLNQSNPKRDYEYPSEFFEKQKRAYPSIRPLVIEVPAEEVFAAALNLVLEFKNWDLVGIDRDELHLEAVSTTKLLRFKDDISIDIIKDSNTRSTVQMRSKSRVGKGDLGKNAERIEEFFRRLKVHFKIA